MRKSRYADRDSGYLPFVPKPDNNEGGVPEYPEIHDEPDAAQTLSEERIDEIIKREGWEKWMEHQRFDAKNDPTRGIRNN